MELRKWEENTGIDVFVAWRIPKHGFRLLRLSEFDEAGNSSSISRERALLINRRLDDVVR